MKVRPALKEDAGALSSLHARAFDRGWSAMELAGLIAQPHTISLAAIEQDHFKAFILVRCLAGEAEILTLATDPDFRRRGAAENLVKAAITACRENQAQTLFLEVAEHNAAAIGLYSGLGFAASGLRKAYYADGSDALVMQMAL